MPFKAVEEDILIRHVEKICQSPEFRSKQVLCKFLSYIVSETLAGRGDQIKAFTIGVDVFGRDADFDPGQDTLVRINAGRLRRALDSYYQNTGKYDAVRIEIPKGGYLPRIIQSPASRNEPLLAPGQERGNPMILEPSIAVLSFKNLTGDPNNSYFAKGFSYELMVELTKFEDLQVYNYLSISDYPEQGSEVHGSLMEKDIRFAVGGAVLRNKERIIMLVDLHDLHDGKQVWSERYSEKVKAENFIEIQENISRKISGKLGSEYGIVLQRLALDSKKQKPRNLGTYTAVLKYFNYLVNHTPETVREAFDALNQAVENDPTSGIALSSLAALHGTAYALDYPNADASYKAAGELAEKAYFQDPNNLLVLLSLAFKCFLYNEKDRFFELADRIVKMNPKGTLRMGALGFHLALYGDWERGKQILDTVLRGHMEYPRYFHGATTLFFYRDGTYEKALEEANLYRVPGFFWGPLLRAAVLGQLSRTEEAKKELLQVEQLKPDFAKKARYLLSRFVKEASLVEHIVEGLLKAGMDIQ